MSSEQSEIKQKQQFTGKVLKTSLAGALIDIGTPQPAVIHISQMVPEDESNPIRKVDEILKPGQEVICWVRRVKEDHVELTMIKPLDLEWREIKPGMSVKGKIVRLEKFGAFVEIGAERPGLVHVSELSHGFVKTPSDVVKEGDEVEAQVLDVDRRKKQIKLSMRALMPEVAEEPAKDDASDKKAGDGEKEPRSNKRQKAEADVVDSEIIRAKDGTILVQGEPDLTVMEIAWNEAQMKAKSRRQEQKAKHRRSNEDERDDIFYRTLEHKARSGQ